MEIFTRQEIEICIATTKMVLAAGLCETPEFKAAYLEALDLKAEMEKVLTLLQNVEHWMERATATARFSATIGDYTVDLQVDQKAPPEYHQGMVQTAIAEVLRRAAAESQAAPPKCGNCGGAMQINPDSSRQCKKWDCHLGLIPLFPGNSAAIDGGTQPRPA